MGPVVQLVVPDAVVAAVGAVVACAVVAAAVALLRSRRRRRATLDEALLRSREEVEALSRKVEELSHEVVRSRRAEQEREYVITSLIEGDPVGNGPTAVPQRAASERTAVGGAAEEQLVRALARRSGSPAGRRWSDLVVGVVALGHGVRRAMSADVRDRAAAEAHVARRQSRRERRRQVRQARRIVRDGRPPGQEVA